MSGRVNKDQYYLPNGKLSEAYYDEHEEIDKDAYCLPNGEFDWRAYCSDAECDFNCELNCEECCTCRNQLEENDPPVEFHDDCINFCIHACSKCGVCKFSWGEGCECDGYYQERKRKYNSSVQDEIEEDDDDTIYDYRDNMHFYVYFTNVDLDFDDGIVRECKNDGECGGCQYFYDCEIIGMA